MHGIPGEEAAERHNASDRMPSRRRPLPIASGRCPGPVWMGTTRGEPEKNSQILTKGDLDRQGSRRKRDAASALGIWPKDRGIAPENCCEGKEQLLGEFLKIGRAEKIGREG